VQGVGEAAEHPAPAVDGQGQRRHLGALVGELAALPGVLVADANIREPLIHAERLQHRAARVAQRDDQMPGERGIVQPVVDQREVGRLAPVAVKRGDDLPAGVLDRTAGRQQLGGVGDKPRVIELPEILALGAERRAVARVVAAVLPRIEKTTPVAVNGYPGAPGSATSRPYDFKPARWIRAACASNLRQRAAGMTTA